MKYSTWILFLTAVFATPVYPQDQSPKELFDKTFGTNASKNWADYLVDTSSGSVSASGMLGVAGDSIHTVENVRDVVVAVKGLGSSASKTALGLSITPARTSFTPMNLTTYAKEGNWPARLLGSLTLGYAQGNAAIAGKDYERRAVSVETSMFLDSNDDPVIAYARAVAGGQGECNILQSAMPDTAPGAPATASTSGAEGPAKPAVAPQGEADAARKRADACREKTLKGLRWNRSQISASFAAGWIKPGDDSRGQVSLGRAAVVGITYGFGDANAKTSSALSLALRRTTAEPVLNTLQAASIENKNSSLAVMRFTGGSKTFRGLVEASNAKSVQVTASERTFKSAVGFDLKVYEAMWVNFRIGQQRKIDGTGNEVGSFLSISYSPSALLKP